MPYQSVIKFPFAYRYKKLKNGIEKVAINTIPEVYKRSKWTGKEKFGIGLYNDFKALKKEFDE